MCKPAGLILWEGPSELDGSPIAVIASCVWRDSQNTKTGPMVQIFVVPATKDWTETPGLRLGVCGDCPLGLNSICYVRGDAVSSVTRALARGSYVRTSPKFLPCFAPAKHQRISAWGDLAAVPAKVWLDILNALGKRQRWTAYTHQWRQEAVQYAAGFAMASCDCPADREEAKARGWRTFRSMLPEETRQAGEILCPASVKAGVITCDRCLICHGGSKGPDVAIVVHGSGDKVRNYRKMRGVA